MRNKSLFFLLALLPFVLFSCKNKVDGDDPDYHLQPVGTSAHDLLSDDNFTSLTVEVLYVDGFAPTQTALDNLKDFLEARLNKPGGITLRKSAISSPGLAPYSLEDLREVESNQRTAFTSDEQLTAYLFIADGEYASNDNVLGVAYRNTSMALFGSKIHDISGGFGQPSTSLVETTVLNHEFGHIMGLVDTGTDLQSDHKDEANGSHCDVQSCLMYWSVETGDVISNLLGSSSAPELDAQCIADLQANGGK